MRLLPFAAMLVLLVKPGIPGGARVATAPCVPTSPMPIARATVRDPMFVSPARPERLAPMPVLELVPCYMADSLARRLVP